MPVPAAYPGIYIQEIPSGTRTITGASPSTAAFVGYLREGPTDEPTHVQSFADFERGFGGLDSRSEVSLAVSQFFANGGGEAWIVRRDGGAIKAAALIPGGGRIEAANPGAWGNELFVGIEPSTAGDALRTVVTRRAVQRDGQWKTTAMHVLRDVAAEAAVENSAEKNSSVAGSPVRIRGGLTVNGLLGDTVNVKALTGAAITLSLTVTRTEPSSASITCKPAPTTGPVKARLEALRTALEPPLAAANLKVRQLADGTGGRLAVLLPADVANSPDQWADYLSFRHAESYGLDLLTPALWVDPKASGKALTVHVTLSPPKKGWILEVEVPIAADTGTDNSFATRFENAVPKAVQPVGDLADDQESPGFIVTRTFDGNIKARYRREDGRAIGKQDGPGRDVVAKTIQDALESFLAAARIADLQDPGSLWFVGTALIGATIVVTEDGAQASPATGRPGLAGRAVSGEMEAPEAVAVFLPGFKSGTQSPLSISLSSGNAFKSAADVAVALQKRISATYPSLRVTAVRDALHVAFTDVAEAATTFRFTGPAVEALGLGRESGPQFHHLAGGADGKPPTDAGMLIGDEAKGTGLHALDRVEDLALLCLPDTRALKGDEARDAIGKAGHYCERRRMFLIADPPKELTRNGIEAWIQGLGDSASANAAVYFPEPEIADPFRPGHRRRVAPSGTMAGAYAATDTRRGIWKAPAGVDVALRGVQGLSVALNDHDSGVLNPLGCNVLRSFPAYGVVPWGARTLHGDDRRASEWKYVPVRRLALHIENSLMRGLQWAVFEPNGEMLWAQIRLAASTFLHRLFVQGAFAGTTPAQAYIVRCDSTTTPPDLAEQGVCVVSIGFAPLKPAEFIVLNIQQITSATA